MSSFVCEVSDGYLITACAPFGQNPTGRLTKLNIAGADTWTMEFPSRFIASVIPFSDEGFLIVGDSLLSNDDHDAYVALFNHNREMQWSRSFGGTGDQRLRGVVESTDGDFILTGWYSETNDPEDRDFYVIRMNDLGDTLWTRMFGGEEQDYGNSILLLPDESLVVSGSTRSFGAGESDYCLLHLNSMGDSLSSHAYGTEAAEIPYSIQPADDNGYLIGGSIERTGILEDRIFLVRIDEDGDTLWTRELAAGQDGSTCTDLRRIGTSQRYALCGGRFPVAGGYSRILLSGISNEGEMQWSMDYELPWGAIATSVSPTSDGGYIIAGMSFDIDGIADVYVVKTGPDTLNPAIDSPHQSIPQESELSAYPSPFNSSTTIVLELKTDLNGKLAIFDSTGREVKLISETFFNRGRHEFEFDASGLPSGTYFAQFEGTGVSLSRKIVLVK